MNRFQVPTAGEKKRQIEGALGLATMFSASHRMRFVSPLLKHAVYPTLHHIGWLNRIMPPGGHCVVNYHGVIPSDHVSAEHFLDGNLVRPNALREQLKFLKVHYDVIHPEDLRASVEEERTLPARAVLVTCDDGLLNVLTDMLPILQAEGVPCLFFVTGASCSDSPGMLWYEELYYLMRDAPKDEQFPMLPSETGAESQPLKNLQSHWWEKVRGASRLNSSARTDWMNLVRKQCGPVQNFHSEKRWRLLNLAELRQLAQPDVTVGAHTLSHPVLSLCNDDEARREIAQSKTDLEQALGRRIWAFAYPFGNPSTMGEREVRLVHEAGFSCAFLNVEHWNLGSWTSLALPRTHVTSTMKLPEFSAHLSGLHTRLQRAAGA